MNSRGSISPAGAILQQEAEADARVAKTLSLPTPDADPGGQGSEEVGTKSPSRLSTCTKGQTEGLVIRVSSLHLPHSARREDLSDATLTQQTGVFGFFASDSCCYNNTA